MRVIKPWFVPRWIITVLHSQDLLLGNEGIPVVKFRGQYASSSVREFFYCMAGAKPRPGPFPKNNIAGRHIALDYFHGFKQLEFVKEQLQFTVCGLMADLFARNHAGDK